MELYEAMSTLRAGRRPRPDPIPAQVLAAHNEGLGCVITTLPCPDEAEIKPLLGIPADWFTCAHVPLGYPVGSGHGPVRRQNVDQLCYRDRWGEPW